MNMIISPNALAAPADIWGEITARLRLDLGDDVFASWFGRLELDRIVGGVAHLSVPTKFLKCWIQSHYSDRMLGVIKSAMPDVRAVTIAIRSTARSNVATVSGPVLVTLPHQSPTAIEKAAAQAQPAPRAAPPIVLCSPLDRRLTFSTFCEGQSNLLAATSARRVAAAGVVATQTNPLYLHGAVGLGKTHLLQAIAQEVAPERRALYMTAEKFIYGFVLALKARATGAVRELLRDVDILLIDDLQFLQGKAIVAEVGRTIDAMLGAGKQIVLAADRPPGDLDALDDRIRSRLSGGLVAEIKAPDLVVRTRLVEARAAAARSVMPGFDLAADVIAHVASVIQTNGRDIDGAVNRLMAHASLIGEPLTVATADLAIRDLVRTREPKRVKIEDIQSLVATHYNVSREDILSDRRTANVVRPRQVAMYLSKVLTPRSLPEIGRRFGGRDHTTALHAVRKIGTLIGEDTALRDEVAGLKTMLEG